MFIILVISTILLTKLSSIPATQVMFVRPTCTDPSRSIHDGNESYCFTLNKLVKGAYNSTHNRGENITMILSTGNHVVTSSSPQLQALVTMCSLKLTSRE